jgi:hypothetical protein
MKIICTVCKSILGEQKPYKDHSEVQVKCVACLAKEEEARKARPIPEVGKDREVAFDNGWKGRLTIAGKETDELSFWDLIVAGKRFTCAEKARDEFEGYLKGIAEEEVDVTFFHSATIKLDNVDGRRKRKQQPSVEEKKPESIHYNCTVKVAKEGAVLFFTDKADRMQKVAEILARSAYKAYMEDQRKAVQKGDLPSMSGQREVDKFIS